MRKPTAVKKHTDFTEEELFQIRNNPRKVRDGKAIIARVEHKYPDKTIERWYQLEDGSEIMEEIKPNGNITEIEQFRSPQTRQERNK